MCEHVKQFFWRKREKVRYLRILQIVCNRERKHSTCYILCGRSSCYVVWGYSTCYILCERITLCIVRSQHALCILRAPHALKIQQAKQVCASKTRAMRRTRHCSVLKEMMPVISKDYHVRLSSSFFRNEFGRRKRGATNDALRRYSYKYRYEYCTSKNFNLSTGYLVGIVLFT
jgi:hypothetical protein